MKSNFVEWSHPWFTRFWLFVTGRFRCSGCLNIVKRKGNPDIIHLTYYDGSTYKPKVAKLKICSACAHDLEEWKKIGRKTDPDPI